MIIGHAPGAYIASTLLHGRLFADRMSARAFILAGVFGGIAPDLDMLYFHLVDQRQHHHHSYFSHWPLVWLGLLLLSLALLRLRPNSWTAPLAVAFATMGMLHMLLDSIVGDIWWFAPFVDQAYALFSVPALYQPWWLNFLLHWSFGLELALWAWALLLYRARTRATPASAASAALSGR